VVLVDLVEDELYLFLMELFSSEFLVGLNKLCFVDETVLVMVKLLENVADALPFVLTHLREDQVALEH
jgi:hypothetical protein